MPRAGRRRDAADHGALLHAVGPLDPGARASRPTSSSSSRRRAAEVEADEAETPDRAEQLRSEADLRGALTNDSLTEDERKPLEEDRARKPRRPRSCATRITSWPMRSTSCTGCPSSTAGSRAVNDRPAVAALPYRPCVGVVLVNPRRPGVRGPADRQRVGAPGRCRRAGSTRARTRAQAALRELVEETGVPAQAVEIVAETPEWMLVRPAGGAGAAAVERPVSRPGAAMVPDAVHRRRRDDRHRPASIPNSAPGPG